MVLRVVFVTINKHISILQAFSLSYLPGNVVFFIIFIQEREVP